MHPYIPHLLADIAAAHQPEVPEIFLPKNREEYFVEMDKWIDPEPGHTFGYYCGLKAEDFPPADQLMDDEMTLIMDEFQKMMHTWKLSIFLPQTLPVSFAYKLTVNYLNKKINIVNYGGISVDRCNGYAPDCEFKEYCICLESWNNATDEDDFPFPDDGSGIPF